MITLKRFLIRVMVKMMVKLSIKEHGLFLSLPGLAPFRTPADLDLTKCDLNLILSELNRLGIKKFKIISEEIEKKPIIPVKEKVRIEKNKIEESNVNQRLEKIELMLKSFIDSKDEIKYSKPSKKTNNKIEKQVEFIPSITPLDLDSEDNNIIVKQDDIDDVSDSADLLSKLGKEN